MPRIRSTSFFTCCACQRRFSSSATPVITKVAVGIELAVVISITVGSSASLGNSSLLFCTSRRRSLTRLSKVLLSMSLKRTRMEESPSRLVLETNLISETLRTASSSTLVMRCSTSLAEAPGKAVCTSIQLKLMVGSCSRGNME